MEFDGEVENITALLSRMRMQLLAEREEDKLGQLRHVLYQHYKLADDAYWIVREKRIKESERKR